MTRIAPGERDFVFLDAGGTLLRVARLEEIFSSLCRGVGLCIELQPMRLILERTLAQMADPGPTSLDLQAHRQWWTEFFERVLDELGFAEPHHPLLSRLWQDYRSGQWVALFPDTVEALGLLRGHGWPLGVISNWDDTLEEFLDRLGISQYFEIVVSSYRVGYEKPDVRIFDYALSLAGARRESSWFVGDNLELDGEGARRAGLRTILVDYDGSYDEPELIPYPVVRSLKDAARHIIASENPTGAP